MLTHPDTPELISAAMDPIIDRDSIERLRRFGGDALLTKMIDMFIESVPARIDAALDAAAKGDCEGAQRAFHSLKSSAAQLGALTLREICEQGESLASERMSAPLLILATAAGEQFVAAVRKLQLVRAAAVQPT